MKKILLIIAMSTYSIISFAATDMNQEKMEKIVKLMSQESKGEKGVVEFQYKNLKMYLISDIKHNRMRIISAIKEYSQLTNFQIESILVSNFHKSLDARYAVSKGVLYSAYIHPLSALNEIQVSSAVDQVANLVLSFGSEYSSGMLSFGGNH